MANTQSPLKFIMQKYSDIDLEVKAFGPQMSSDMAMYVLVSCGTHMNYYIEYMLIRTFDHNLGLSSCHRKDNFR